MNDPLELTFISPRFLFPTDSGGKIRSTQILRGMKGGAFRITLVMPSNAGARARHARQIDSVCDELSTWEEPRGNAVLRGLQRVAWLLNHVPVSVRSDRNAQGSATVALALQREPDVVVFDFPHSAVLAPPRIDPPAVVFTHNIEAQILERHWQVARSPFYRWVWRQQYLKMRRFERDVLAGFDTVIAVSDDDCGFFGREYGIEDCKTIPTGVDTEFFAYTPPEDDGQVVFLGSMDWMANIDGVEFFFDEVWPRVRHRAPQARMKVVGRSPPAAMVEMICNAAPEWEFSGFVDDVRPHVSGAAAFVIPLRVGGGTRIKVFEAMAMGIPVVSTSIGIEGLDVEEGVHFLRADTPESMADAVVSLLEDRSLRNDLARSARRLVEDRFGYRRAAQVFEQICLDTFEGRAGR